MKNIFLFCVILLLFVSCGNQSELNKDFECTPSAFDNLENLTDFKNKFAIQLPKTWKTNLYYDDIQSSIFSADTVKQLTETLLLDITYINKEVNFDSFFKLNQEQESLKLQLIQMKGKEINLLEKPTYYTISKGKKGGFSYQIGKFFIKINEDNFILAKAEIYGDSLVNERMCTAISFIENIKIKDK